MISLVAVLVAWLGAGSAVAFDLSIAQCVEKNVVALGRGGDVEKAKAAALRACVHDGGTAACCQVQVSTYPRIARHRGRTLCLAAVKGPGGVVGAGGSSDAPNAVLRAREWCAHNMGEGLPERTCEPNQTVISACRPPPAR
jgi:hypothetical protein